MDSYITNHQEENCAFQKASGQMLFRKLMMQFLEVVMQVLKRPSQLLPHDIIGQR